MRHLLTPLAALAVLVAVACERFRNSSAGGTQVTVTPSVDEKGVLLLDGLGDLGPHIQAAMGTAEERAARAPYSPEGWPINRGDVVSHARYSDNQGEFGSWLGVRQPFWVGDMVFGARWTFSHEEPASGSFWPEELTTSRGDPVHLIMSEDSLSYELNPC